MYCILVDEAQIQLMIPTNDAPTMSGWVVGVISTISSTIAQTPRRWRRQHDECFRLRRSWAKSQVLGLFTWHLAEPIACWRHSRPGPSQQIQRCLRTLPRCLGVRDTCTLPQRPDGGGVGALCALQKQRWRKDESPDLENSKSVNSELLPRMWNFTTIRCYYTLIIISPQHVYWTTSWSHLCYILHADSSGSATGAESVFAPWISSIRPAKRNCVGTAQSGMCRAQDCVEVLHP